MSDDEGLKRVLLQLEKKPESYKANLSCMNCGQGYGVTVPKGKLVAEIDSTCPNCGCSASQTERFFAKRREPTL